MTALDFVAAAFIVLPMLFVIAACAYEIWRLATRKRGLKRIDTEDDDEVTATPKGEYL